MKYNLVSKAGLSLMLLLYAGLGHAEFEIKNVRCADAVITTPLPDHNFHFNGSQIDKTITVQITRDGCRPKDVENNFVLRIATTGGAETGRSSMLRVGRVPSSATEDLPAVGVASVLFINQTTSPTRGTFNYKYVIE